MNTDESAVRLSVAEWNRLRAREKELLEANNREVERRRRAEADWREAMEMVSALTDKVRRLEALKGKTGQ